MDCIYAESFRVNCQDSDTAEVEAIFGRFGQLRTAAAIAAWSGCPASVYSLRNVAELIDAVNPKYPLDSFDMMTLVALLGHRARLSAEEFAILRRTLPDRGEYRFTIRSAAGRLSVSVWRYPKNGNPSHIVFTGIEDTLGFPLNVHVSRYADMDDIDNHNDECPSRLPEDHPEYSDDCNCEAQVEHEDEIEVKDWDDDLEARIRDFIYGNVVS